MSIKRSLAILAMAFYSSTSFAATLVDVSQQGLPRLKSSDYQLKEIRQVTDKAGNVHTRFEETYQGVPVYGYQVIQHEYQSTVAAHGVHLAPYTGTMVQDIEQDLVKQTRFATVLPQTTLDKLKTDYAKAHGVTVDQLTFENELAREVIFIDDKQKAHVAHEVSFFVDTPEGGSPARPYYLFDVTASKILKTWDGLAHAQIATGPGGNQRIGLYQYGEGFPMLEATKNRGRCTFSSPAGKTVDMNNRMGKSTTAFSYLCVRSANQASDTVNGAGSPLNDAEYFISILTKFYSQQYNSTPVPFPLVMRTHYGKDYANAFWNGTSMTYGDGNKDLYPFVVLDISAHEIAHGYTEHNAGLVYDGQSGGINEAFSDMASRAVEYFVYTQNDWYLGGDIYKDTSILAMRYMDNPPLDGKSIDNVANYTNDLDVHYSSGIFNKAFYLLATTPGWNTLSAFDAMHYANAGYWQPNATFASAAWGVVEAAAAHGQSVDDVINAFAGVGIQCDKNAGQCT